MKYIDLYSTNVCNPTSNIVIVGNAYGIMPYIKPLAKEFAKNGIKPFWFPFSGQEGRSGVYSFKEGVKDLKDAISIVKLQSNLPIHILAHCAGSLITLEYLQKSEQVDIDKLIIYGLLYNMNRRRSIAERKLINVGVNFDIKEEDWRYNPSEAIKKINKTILFCHPKDRLNLERATIEEMNGVMALKDGNKIKWFDNGYDNENQNISGFIDTYTSYLKGQYNG